MIIDLVAQKIADGNILKIIRQFLKSGVMEDGKLKKTIMGTPQRGVISPLLAGVVLDVLDRGLAKHGDIFVRYADDFLVLAKSTSDIEKAQELVRDTIENVLKHNLESNKTKVTTFKEKGLFHFSHLFQRTNIKVFPL